MAAIVAGDILFKYSTTAGAAGNAGVGTAAGSLGKYISQTVWPDVTPNGLFDDISGAENAADTVDYRCIFIHNNNGANIYQNVVVWMTDVAGGASLAIGVDPAPASPIGQAGVQAATIANELAVPAGVTFTSPITQGAGLALGSIGVAQCRAVWLRRTAAHTSALSNDGVTLLTAGDTGSL